MPDSVIVDFSFEITNPTKLPLTLLRVRTEIYGQIADSAWNVNLAPNVPYMIDRTVILRQKDKIRRFSQGLAVFNLVGFVYFLDVFKDRQVQAFGKLCGFGWQGMSFTQYMGELPEAEQEPQTKRRWWKFW